MPNPDQIENLKALATNILQPVRSNFDKPLIISSGFRCAELCIAIGGSIKSQHERGEAADFEIWGTSVKLAVSFIELSPHLVLVFHSPHIYISYILGSYCHQLFSRDLLDNGLHDHSFGRFSLMKSHTSSKDKRHNTKQCYKNKHCYILLVPGKVAHLNHCKYINQGTNIGQTICSTSS